MIDSPLIKEIVAENTQKVRQEARQEAIIDILQARFNQVPEGIVQQLRNIRAGKKLQALVKHAAQCADLEAFRRRLLAH